MESLKAKPGFLLCCALIIIAVAVGGGSISYGNSTVETDQRTTEGGVKLNSKTFMGNTGYFDDLKAPAQQCESPSQYCANGSCCCGNRAPNDIVRCDAHNNLTVLSCYCVTFNGTIEFGNCVYNVNSEDPYHPLPRNLTRLNDYVCGEKFNRKGTLCGECKDGYSPRAYSFDMDCIRCPHGKANWWKFLLIAFVPLTVFCLTILFLRINVTSSHLFGFVMYSQAAYAPAFLRLYILSTSHSVPVQYAIRVVGVMYGFWNLDFFRSLRLEICLETDTIQMLALDLVVGVYPQVLVIMTYVLIYLHDRNCAPITVLWKPFGKIFSLFSSNWDIRTSLIDAFATFFLLSNYKLLSASCDLLIPVKVYQLMPSGSFSYSWRVFYDATLPYLGTRHLPYAILALSVLALFVVLPVLLLLLYPFKLFQRFLNLFPFRWYILHTFVDSFQGCYKDGTEPGTYDCRWFPSFYFMIRFAAVLIGVFTLNGVFFPLATILLTLVLIFVVQLEPLKTNMNHASIVNIVSLLFLALFYASLTGIMVCDSKASTAYILKIMYGFVVFITVSPLVYISVLSLFWINRHKRFGLEFLRRLRYSRQGYQALE